MPTPSMGDTSPCTGGVSLVIIMGVAVRLGLCFEGRNVHVLNSSVHFASIVDNLKLKIQYFWTLQKLNVTVA